jgi:uncharacterized protein (DUF849 family)
MAEKLIITAALTGAVMVPTQNPHLPFAPEHLIADAEACVKAGASAIHVHAHNPQTGQPSSSRKLFARLRISIAKSLHQLKRAPCSDSKAGAPLPFQKWRP